MTIAETKSHSLGEAESIWFKLTPLLKDPDNPMQMLLRMSEKYGGVIPINLKNQRLVFLSDVSHFRHVLVKNSGNYEKYFDGLIPIFGKSMITIDGALWQKVRKPQHGAFHPKKFEEYFPYLLDAIGSKENRWNTLAESGEVVEMVEETWTLACEMVCKALFDREMPFNPHHIFGAVKAYTNVMNHKSIRLKKNAGELVEVADEDAGKAMETWGSVPDMVLNADSIANRETTLLTMLENAEANPDLPEFDHQQVVDEMKQYLWAGTETTALTLAWCLYLLSTHPEIKEKVRQEAITVCGDNADPTWENINDMVYTRQVIQETMRLYPPVWALIRTAAEDDEIDGVQIKAGDNIVLCSYAVHHSSKFWDDPEKFDPDRFSKENLKDHTKFAYVPFGAGKRVCIGGALSQIENMMALAQLVRKFDAEYVGEVPAKISPTVTLTPKGLNFRIHKR